MYHSNIIVIFIDQNIFLSLSFVLWGFFCFFFAVPHLFLVFQMQKSSEERDELKERVSHLSGMLNECQSELQNREEKILQQSIALDDINQELQQLRDNPTSMMDYANRSASNNAKTNSDSMISEASSTTSSAPFSWSSSTPSKSHCKFTFTDDALCR